MGRKTISNQIHSALADKIAFGESKHLDKIEQETTFGKSTYKIYSLILMIIKHDFTLIQICIFKTYKITKNRNCS